MVTTQELLGHPHILRHCHHHCRRHRLHPGITVIHTLTHIPAVKGTMQVNQRPGTMRGIPEGFLLGVFGNQIQHSSLALIEKSSPRPVKNQDNKTARSPNLPSQSSEEGKKSASQCLSISVPLRATLVWCLGQRKPTVRPGSGAIDLMGQAAATGLLATLLCGRRGDCT